MTLSVGGLWLAGTAAANAAEAPAGDGIATGDQAVVELTVPVAVSGNGISVLGDSSSADSAADSAAADSAASVALSPSSIGGVLSGDQAALDVAVPVTVAGNGISVLGDSSSADAATSAPAGDTTTVEGGGSGTASDPAIASGIQAPLDVAVPVTVGGNAVSVLGDSTSTDAGTATPTGGSTQVLGGTSDGGILSGLQAPVDAAVPVTVGGNAISVLGDSASSDASTAAPASGSTEVTGGEAGGGLLSDLQAPVDAAVPVTVGGNAISVVGDSATSGSDASAPAAGASTAVAGGTGDGIVSGVQAPVDAAVPVTVGGNAISVVGDSATSGSDASASAADRSTATAGSNDGGVLSGIQAPVDAAAPVTVGGNAISVVGDSTTSDASMSAPATEGSTATVGSGGDGVLSGVQVPVGAALPVTIGGNAISGAGDSEVSGSITQAPEGGAADSTGGTGDGILGDIGLPVGAAVPVTIGGNGISVLGRAMSVYAPAAPGGVTAPADPADPTDPAAPATPAAPADPAAPATPAAPAAPAAPVTSIDRSTIGAAGGATAIPLDGSNGASASAAASASGVRSGSMAGGLASTGSDELGLGAIAALIAMLGVLALLLPATRERRRSVR